MKVYSNAAGTKAIEVRILKNLKISTFYKLYLLLTLIVLKNRWKYCGCCRRYGHIIIIVVFILSVLAFIFYVAFGGLNLNN